MFILMYKWYSLGTLLFVPNNHIMRNQTLFTCPVGRGRVSWRLVERVSTRLLSLASINCLSMSPKATHLTFQCASQGKMTELNPQAFRACRDMIPNASVFSFRLDFVRLQLFLKNVWIFKYEICNMFKVTASTNILPRMCFI